LIGRRRVAFQRRTSPRFGREFFFWADNGQSGSYRAISRLVGIDLRGSWMTAIRNLVHSQRFIDGIRWLNRREIGLEERTFCARACRETEQVSKMFLLRHVLMRNCLGEQTALYSGSAPGCEREKIFDNSAFGYWLLAFGQKKQQRARRSMVLLLCDPLPAWDWDWVWDWVTQGSRKGHPSVTPGSPLGRIE
jgi:hypothetical protein